MSLTRLLNLYRYARVEERDTGAFWYDTAALEVRTLAASYGFSFEVVAGVVAVLSPNCYWDVNLHDAEEVLSTVRFGGVLEEIKTTTYNRNKDKAIAIALGGKVFPYLNGPKVEAFFHCICGDYSEVAIDAHAINAWAGERIAGSNMPWVPRATMRRGKRDYLRAAWLRNMEPARFQAIIWATHRRRINEGKVEGYDRGLR